MVLPVARVTDFVIAVPINGIFCNCRGLFNVRAPVDELKCPVAAVPGGRLAVTVLPVTGSVNLKGAKVAVTAPVEVLILLIIEIVCENGPGNRRLFVQAVTVALRILVMVGAAFPAAAITLEAVPLVAACFAVEITLEVPVLEAAALVVWDVRGEVPLQPLKTIQREATIAANQYI